MKSSSTISFFCAWLKSPRAIGSVTPSGRALANKMASFVNPEEPGNIIELGGGTGSLTQALIKRVGPKRIIVLERNPALTDILKKKFPTTAILNADAQHLQQIVTDKQLQQINAVVSGLPLLSLPQEIRDTILTATFKVLPLNGTFIQFSYSPFPSIPKVFRQKHGLKARLCTFVPQNIPPAFIWTYTKTRDTS